MNEKILDRYSVRIWNWSFFYEHHKEKIKVDKNGCKYILFRIDVYFTEYFLAIKIDEQNHEGRELIFEKKRQEALKKNMVARLLELIQAMQKEAMMQTMTLVKYKHLLVKKLEKESNKKNKRKRKQNKITTRRNKKIKTLINKSKFSKIFYQITKNEKHTIRN